MNLDFNNFVYALVTSTTYGNWLPGDSRGFVDKHDQFGTPFDVPQPKLKRYAESVMQRAAIWLNHNQAERILESWKTETKKKRWYLFVVAIMPNHFHLVIAALHGTDKATLLRTLKSRASFALNKAFGKRTWWTTSGSVRFCFDEPAVRARIQYVRNQKNPLLVWENPEPF